ncbi:dTDP-4-dehydrorhamnose 3,5-epimerase family protein [Streptomyces sp. GMR22]|uniref:dTDP-4-dehydrorhamnose 3,5-epimerase family protein n=1 Tax=Streptomyces sp. GMR22 TaxID=2759524 RepID=UPI0015FDC4A6|nr:dTDP-4-dehydrorhamnose 3,5-epimerase family protein [Streptomyces sp. GMR22]MBA6437037.1 dTDP-4-dehydrorhamnose 3,5-epimerase family protein [Streptomyces sp. GMR22]
MQVSELKIEGGLVFTPEVFRDDRGHFLSPYQETAFTQAVGRSLFPVRQASYSLSRRGVVRGIHFTATPPGMAKYAYCTRGRAIDYVVDLRIGSPTFGIWDSVCLDHQEFRSVYLPVGVGHLFVSLEENTAVSYLLSAQYAPERERAVSPLDPELALPFPPELDLLLSERDRQAPTLAQAQAAGLLPSYAESRRCEVRGSADEGTG